MAEAPEYRIARLNHAKSKIDEAWNAPGSLARRTFVMTCYMSVLVSIFSAPLIGFEPTTFLVTSGVALVVSPLVDMIHYRILNWRINRARTEWLLGGNLVN